MPELKTIKIVNPDGPDFILINESDFDPKIHTRWEQRKPSKSKSDDKTETEISQSQDATTDSVLARINELEALYTRDGWRPIADLGESLGIEKPDGGWRDAIPLIAEREQQS